MNGLTKFILTVLVLCTFGFGAVQAQHACGTVMSDKMLKWLENYKSQPQQQLKSVEDYEYIELHFHLVGNNNGAGYLPLQTMYDLVCNTNEYYKTVGMQFFVREDGISYYNNSNVYDHEIGDIGGFMNNNNKNGVVNVYIVNTIAGGDGGGIIAGYYSPGPDALSVRKGFATEDYTTFAHELGHYFSMPHPFQGWEYGTPNANQQERVARSGPTANCHNRGDYFCDTAADYLSDPWGCPYNGSLTDPDGVPIEPDHTLIMSYADDNCTQRFSPEQIDAMLAYLYDVRPYLLNSQSQVNVEDLVPAVQVFPADDATNIPATAVKLIWDASPTADYYHLLISSTISGIVDEVLLTTTSYETILQPNHTYLWKVRAVNDGNSCAGFSPSNSFTTASGDVSIQVESITIQQPTCTGWNNGSIYVQATGGMAPYDFDWSSGQSGDWINNLAADTYTVTISDQGGNSNTVEIYLGEPGALAGVIDQTENKNAVLSISGGTPPYNIEWPDLSTGKEASDLEPGMNTVSIWDANGCLTTAEVNIIGASGVTGNVSCFGANDGLISLDEPEGGIAPFSYNWSHGGDNNKLQTGLAAGDYTVEVEDAAGNTTELGFTIDEPTELSVQVNVQGNDAYSFVQGGTPPYTMAWSNGSSAPSQQDLDMGDYFLYVQDANFCNQTIDFSITTVGIETLENGSVKLFPNPLGAEDNLQFQFNLLEPVEVGVQILDAAGRLVLTENWNTQSGTFNRTLDTAQLANGIYFVQLQVGEELILDKVVVSK